MLYLWFVYPPHKIHFHVSIPVFCSRFRSHSSDVHVPFVPCHRSFSVIEHTHTHTHTELIFLAIISILAVYRKFHKNRNTDRMFTQFVWRTCFSSMYLWATWFIDIHENVPIIVLNSLLKASNLPERDWKQKKARSRTRAKGTKKLNHNRYIHMIAFRHITFFFSLLYFIPTGCSPFSYNMTPVCLCSRCGVLSILLQSNWDWLSHFRRKLNRELQQCYSLCVCVSLAL